MNESRVLSSWKVSLISTGYDIPDLRAGLGEFLKKRGFVVLAYDRAGFPAPPDVHAHEACIIALNQADIVVLIIDKRYGSLYLGIGPSSITEEEYRSANKTRKIIIPCIRRRAWDEQFQLFEAENALLAKGNPNPRSTLHPTYVENWQVLDFIERVRKADINNFIIQFDDLVDLQDKLKGRLRGISFWLLQSLVRDQICQVEAMKTTTAMFFSLGDVLGHGYFVDSPFKMKSGTASPEDTPSAVLLAMREKNASAAILGDPGSGKSTLLSKTFLDHAQASFKENSPSLPFFISLRGRGDFSFDYQSYMNECFSTTWRKTPYPLLALDSAQPTFYMDGFDEMAEDQASLDLNHFWRSTIYGFPFILACRSRYANQFLNQTVVGDRLSAVIELQSWDSSIANKYIEQFCRIRKRTDIVEGLKTAFASSSEMSEIAGNPLLLTLFLCLVEEIDMAVPLDIRDKRTLLSKTLENWARRELGRLRGSSGVSSDEQNLLLQAWRVAAWHLYSSRFSDAPFVRLRNLLSMVKSNVPKATSILEKEAFAGLFDIRSQTEEVTGLIHEQLLEELVAELLCEGMRTGGYPFPESLGIAVRWEINQLIRSIWSEDDQATKNATLGNLSSAFQSSLLDESPSNVLRRNQAAYYMGRLETPVAVNELRKANAKENNLFVKLSLGFGLIKRLQFDVEDNFIRQLRDDPDWDAGNRGYHLFYYRDWNVRDVTPPYKDPGDIAWDGTLRALLRHIESSEMKHVAIRRVELHTIRRFLETRGAKGPLKEELLGRIERAVIATTQFRYPAIPAEFERNLIAECARLKTTWKEMP